MAEIKQNLKLTDLLEACLDFKKDPTPENEARIKVMVDELIILEYMPLMHKQANIVLILGLLTEKDQNDAISSMLKISLGKILLGVLSYAANLENNLDRASFTPAVVDLLYECGIIDAILEHAQKDFNRFEAMLQEAINFSNLFALAETAALMDTEHIQSFIDSVGELKSLDPKMLDNLKSLAVAGSPEFQALKETLVDEALGMSINEDLASLEKKPEKSVKPKKENEEDSSEEEKEDSEA